MLVEQLVLKLKQKTEASVMFIYMDQLSKTYWHSFNWSNTQRINDLFPPRGDNLY